MRIASPRVRWLAPLFGLLLSAELCFAVPFVKDAKEVLDGELERPAVVVFGATWCGWCRKMDTVTLTHETVEGLADDFIWVKVDIEEQEELAAQYGVRGVPETIVLNEHGAIIGNVSGYVPPERFVEFLKQTLESPQADAVPLPRVIEEFLASEGRIIRRQPRAVDAHRHDSGTTRSTRPLVNS